MTTGQVWIKSERRVEGVYIVIEEQVTNEPLAHIYLTPWSAVKVAWKLALDAMRHPKP